MHLKHKETNSKDMFLYSNPKSKIVDLLILLHTNHIVFVRVRRRSNKSQPVAVFRVGGVYIEERHLSRAQNLHITMLIRNSAQ